MLGLETIAERRVRKEIAKRYSEVFRVLPLRAFDRLYFLICWGSNCCFLMVSGAVFVTNSLCALLKGSSSPGITSEAGTVGLEISVS